MLSSTGLPLLHLPLWVPPAEEHCAATAQQRPTGLGEDHTETTAPPAG